MKFIRNFINKIKNIFIKEKKIDNNVNEEVLESLSKEKQVIENNENIYEQISVGDIIWAKRYNNEEEMELIPEGHREGPFIVLSKQDGKLYCAQGTGIPPYTEYADGYFFIDDTDYTLRKATYFNLIKLVPIDSFSFIEKIDKLKDCDLSKIYRQIKIKHKLYYTKQSRLIRLNMPIQIGDIIRNNKKIFIIINIDENKFTCIPLDNKINFRNHTEININNFLNLDYSKIFFIENNTYIKYINSINDNILKYILKCQKEYIESQKHTQEIQRGSIVLKENKLYYIYGEEGQNWLVFEIKSNKESELAELELGNKIYYTDYNDKKIDKKESLENIFICNDCEKDKVKKSRKSYKEEKKNIEMYGASQLVYFNVGDIIENINYKGNRYIIIGIKKKTYECLNITDIKKAIYNPILIRKIDSKISKNVSIEGIKWLEQHRNFNFKRIGKKEILDQIFETQKESLSKNQINDELKPSTNTNVVNQKSNFIELNTLIKTNEFSEETFVVKEILGDMLVCVSTIDLGVANAPKHYFNKNNVIIVKERQKRK